MNWNVNMTSPEQRNENPMHSFAGTFGGLLLLHSLLWCRSLLTRYLLLRRPRLLV